MRLFYKYQARAKVKYLIVTNAPGGWLYIRHENNIVPDSTVLKYNISFTSTIQELTGLEIF